MSSPALRRLQEDLKALKKFPIVGANAEPLDSEMMTWYGLIIPQGNSNLAGTPVRFVLEFSNDCPNVGPYAYFESKIYYTHGATYKDSKGRVRVCLNLFGAHWGTSGEGWSPSYTVTTMLVSMQALFIDGMLSNRINHVSNMVQSALNFRCPVTNHDGSDSAKYFPKVITDPEEAIKIAASNNTEMNSPLDNFYICYANQKFTARNSILGCGIQIENASLGTLSSPCEYLSFNSYMRSGIRRSSTNKTFKHWLPILINETDWEQGVLIKKTFLFQVCEICEDIIGFREKPEAEKVFKVCSSLMNSLVVEIMNNGSKSTANDKFINGYFAIYRLFLAYGKGSEDLESFANAEIKKYLENLEDFTKTNVPNLGEFLINLTISTKYEWQDICQMFMQECDVRNVSWYSKTFPLGNLSIPMPLEERATKVFEATAVSRRLVMFQVRFCTVAKTLRESGLLEMESGEWNFPKLGLVPDSVKETLKGLYDIVTEVENWAEMFDFLGMDMDFKDNVKRGQELVSAFVKARKQGYHPHRFERTKKRTPRRKFTLDDYVTFEFQL